MSKNEKQNDESVHFFIEREKQNNEVINEGVKNWAKKILQKEVMDPDELAVSPHYLGELNDEHVSVKSGSTISDKEFAKLMKDNRITVEGSVLRWLRTNSTGLMIAKSQVEKMIKDDGNKNYLYLKIEVEK